MRHAEGKTVGSQSASRRLWVVCGCCYTDATCRLTRIAGEFFGELDIEGIYGPSKHALACGEREEGAGIYRVAGIGGNVKHNPIPQMIWLGISTLSKGLAKFRGGDRVLVATTPSILPFVVAFAAIANGGVYTLLVPGDRPGMPVGTDIHKRSAVLVNIAELLNRWLYKSASEVIVVGSDMKEFLARKTRGLDVSIVEFLTPREAVYEYRARSGALAACTLESVPGRQAES